ncbi:MAG: hypothetical protein ACO4B4_08105 [Planctomycetota bacterium]
MGTLRFLFEMLLGLIALSGVLRLFFQLAMLPLILRGDPGDEGLPGLGGWFIGLCFWGIVIAIPVVILRAGG